MIEETDERERQRRHHAVREHHQHRAGHADDIQRGDAQQHVAHVADRAVADDKFPVLLRQRRPARVEDIEARQNRDQVRPMPRAFGHSGNASRMMP